MGCNAKDEEEEELQIENMVTSAVQDRIVGFIRSKHACLLVTWTGFPV